MSTSKWGPPIWIFFHSLIEKIKDENFSDVRIPVINFIRQISSNLPCPDCSNHATLFFSKVNFNFIKTKDDLRQLLYVFHNMVNKRKNKKPFSISGLQSYQNVNLIEIYNKFIEVYKTTGNMKLLADNFQRQIIVKNLKIWLINNINKFNK
jgi:hypothetical protein